MNSKDIINILYRELIKKGYSYFACNTFAIDYESDFIAISKTDFITEFEIKISRSDFFKDFTKEEKHLKMINKNCVANYFYFVVPRDLVKENEIPTYAGLIYIVDKKRILIAKQAPILHKGKINNIILIKILKSMMYKYFNHKMATVTN